MTLTIHSLDDARLLDLDWPDIYFTPNFGRVSEISDGGNWQVATWNGGEIIYPFLKRPIEGSDHFDITSPYGYAGIFARPNISSATLKQFRDDFRVWAKNAHIVSEFVRMSSLKSDQTRLRAADPLLEISKHNRTVRLNIGVDYETYFSANEGRSRTKVRKARKLGYSAEISQAGVAFFAPGSDFRTLYHDTMMKVDAKPYYLFSDEYFQAIHDELGERVFGVTARNALGEVAMSGFFFVWNEFLHVHLDGATRQGLRDGVGNFFFDVCAAWGCDNPELKWMHVGGGLSEDDSLFRFKMSFGGTPTDYYLGRSVLNKDAYDALVGDRANDLGTDAQALHDSGFFPAYRATLS